MVEDLIVAAFNDAKRRVDDFNKNRDGKANRRNRPS